MLSAIELTLVAMLLICNVPAYSQSGAFSGRDYYAPRITPDQIQTLANVESHHLGLGLQQMKRKAYVQAQAEFEFILRVYPNHAQALTSLSGMCLEAPQYCKVAEDWFEKAFALNPNASGTHLMYGFHLHRKRDTKAAVKAYQRAVELDPDSVNAHYNLGLAYADLKQFELANQHAQISYQLGANMPGLRVRLEKLGKWNPATGPAARVTPPSEPTQQ